MKGSKKLDVRFRLAALSLGWLIVGAEQAQARQEVLQWTHPDAASVQRFEALFGTTSGGYGTPVSLGKPTPNTSGVFQGAITVADGDSIFVVVRAIGSSGEISANSAERFRAAPAPTGGTGGSTGGTAPSPTFNFDNLAAGNSVPGWVDTTANYGLTIDDSLFSIAATSLGGSFTTSSVLANIHSHMAAPAPTTNQNYRLRGGMSLGSATGGIGVTVYSGFPTTSNYYRLGRLPGETFKLSGRPGLVCAQADTGYLPSPNGSYAFDIAVESLSDRNRIHAKVWTLGGVEPSASQVVCDDTSASRPTSGTFGVWATGDGTKFWDGFVQQPLTSSLPAPSTTVQPLAPPVLIQIVPVK